MSSSSLQALPTEIIEQILLHLPMAPLLFAQSVCRRFQNIIKESVALQQALFFAEQPSFFPFVAGMHHPYHHHVQNPPLNTRFPEWVEDKTIDHEARLDFKHPKSRYVRDDPKNIFLPPMASWRQMFTAQPPYKSLDVFPESGWWDNYSDDDEAELRRNLCSSVSCEDGIRMGLLVQEVETRYQNTEADDCVDDVGWLECIEK